MVSAVMRVYKIILHGRTINQFATFKGADKYVRAYNKLTRGMHNGAIVQMSMSEA